MRALSKEAVRFFNRITDTNERGEPVSSEAAMLLESGWDGVGYLMHPTTPELAVGGMRKRAVWKSEGPGAAAEYEKWFRARLAQGYVAGWRFYLTRNPDLPPQPYKGKVVYRRCTEGGSVLVEFVPYALGVKGKWEELVAALSEESAVEEVANLFLTLMEHGPGRTLWVVTGAGPEADCR